ncbi:hypothetical protein ACHAXA_010573 [Cyclostephanos tholiformis]|uniref:Uncharacterized protein n=1 Tax=Cyclostephanos tholiformis TaxID=382380 RepID=A0ABD3RZA1_9STRA
MRMKSSSTFRHPDIPRPSSSSLHYKLAVFFPLLLASSFLTIVSERRHIRNIRGQISRDRASFTPEGDDIKYQWGAVQYPNQYALTRGELPGYTGWSRPEQTLAGYFDVVSLSHPTVTSSHSRYHSIIKGGDIFSLLLTCNHNRTDGSVVASEPPYECPQNGGTLFYVRAYGPSVITGIVTDFRNSSYSVEMTFIDPGEYTLEVVVTFSVPMDFDEFPLSDEVDVEPGYEGYMVSNFPLQILVESTAPTIEGMTKPWCTPSQLTESSPESSLYKGHWQVIDKVAHMSHHPLTPDETTVSLDGYRMGLNSLGVRMRYVHEECELIHIRDLLGAISGGLDRCLHEQLGFNIPITSDDDGGMDGPSGDTSNAADDEDSNSIVNQARVSATGDGKFEGVHVIFIGDSVMRLVRFFFLKLIGGSRGFKVTFIETNGGIHATIQNITSTLAGILRNEESTNVKRVILFNSGLHDIDILCSSKRSQTRSKTNVMRKAISCQDAYRAGMTDLVRVLDEYPADLKLFRSTTAGKKQT